jgi:3-oxoacyl-[acyl-carrier protein] reductase
MADVALVCGAGGALGSALVEAFLARGDQVVGLDRQPAKLEPGTALLRFEAVDLTRPESVAELWERLAAAGETPRWVVNAVGGYRAGTVADSEPDDVSFLHELNLGTAWWSCREAARHLAEGAAILNVSARAGLSGGSEAAAYAVSKAGVVRLTEVLASELAPRGIRVNAMLPALIDTPANRAVMGAEALRRAVAPAALASVASFLLSDAAAAVTGAILPVYGFA